VAEGYLGPIIGKLSIQEAGEMGILAKQKVKLISVSESNSIKDLINYKEIYSKAIINSNVRNLLIVKEVEKIVTEYVEKPVDEKAVVEGWLSKLWKSLFNK
jgi:hypothetical protein